MYSIYKRTENRKNQKNRFCLSTLFRSITGARSSSCHQILELCSHTELKRRTEFYAYDSEQTVCEYKNKPRNVQIPSWIVLVALYSWYVVQTWYFREGSHCHGSPHTHTYAYTIVYQHMNWWCVHATFIHAYYTFPTVCTFLLLFFTFCMSFYFCSLCCVFSIRCWFSSILITTVIAREREGEREWTSWKG